MLKIIVKAVSAAVGAAHEGGRGAGNGGGRVLKEKAYQEVGKLTRGQEQWAERAYDFKIATSTMSTEVKRVKETIETKDEKMNVKKIWDADAGKVAAVGLEQRGAELFQILVLKTDNEAKLLVKSVGEDGFRAWQMPFKHYHRKTFAKAIKDHREVMHSKPLRTMLEVVGGVVEWEDKVRRLEKTYGC